MFKECADENAETISIILSQERHLRFLTQTCNIKILIKQKKWIHCLKNLVIILKAKGYFKVFTFKMTKSFQTEDPSVIMPAF